MKGRELLSFQASDIMTFSIDESESDVCRSTFNISIKNKTLHVKYSELFIYILQYKLNKKAVSTKVQKNL